MSHCWGSKLGWNRGKSIKNWKTQSQSKILSRCSYIRHVWLYEANTLKITGLHHFAHWNEGCFWQYIKENLWKNLKLKTYIPKELPKCKITISAAVDRHDHGKASLTILHLSQKFKDLSISFVYNSSIGAFSLSNGGLHLNGKGLGRLAINLKLKIRKLWYELEPMNDDHDKEMLDENTNNFQGQKSLTYEFSTLDKVATEEEDVKSTLGSLKLRNMSSLIFGQIENL